MPQVSGSAPLTLGQKIWNTIAPFDVRRWFYEEQERLTQLWDDYGIPFLIIVGILLVIYILWRRSRRRQKNVYKLWSFVVFFLHKREMMIPLLHTLSRTHQTGDPHKRALLLELREYLAKHPFDKKPAKRIILEKKFSETLLHFSTAFENSPTAIRLRVMAQELAFIESNLQEAHTVYLHNASAFNKSFARFFGMKRFTTTRVTYDSPTNT